jgi:N-terminal acetyltransferase B complex non-catalytic subunit
VLDATFSYDTTLSNEESSAVECSRHIQRSRELFTRIAEEDGQKDRSGLLALLELEKRARARGLSDSMSIYPLLLIFVINNANTRHYGDG